VNLKALIFLRKSLFQVCAFEECSTASQKRIPPNQFRPCNFVLNTVVQLKIFTMEHISWAFSCDKSLMYVSRAGKRRTKYSKIN